MIRTLDARARDNQTRKIQENITNVEKHFGDMCQLFAAYARKTARLRDKADLLVREIGLYADTETPDLKRGMKQFAEHLAKIQDYRQAEVERLEARVIEPLKSYGAVVKRKREDLKATQSARDREAKQMTQLEKTRMRNPSDRQIISQAESELQRATMDATRTTKQLEETIDEFERQKIQDIKKVFGEFVTVEMSFHAKALEIYTSAFQSIQSVNEEADLEVFRSSLHPPDFQSRLDIVRANSKTSLDRTGSFLSTSGTLQGYYVATANLPKWDCPSKPTDWERRAKRREVARRLRVTQGELQRSTSQQQRACSRQTRREEEDQDEDEDEDESEEEGDEDEEEESDDEH